MFTYRNYLKRVKSRLQFLDKEIVSTVDSDYNTSLDALDRAHLLWNLDNNEYERFVHEVMSEEQWMRGE